MDLTTGEFPHEPRVDRTEGELALFGAGDLARAVTSPGSVGTMLTK